MDSIRNIICKRFLIFPHLGLLIVNTSLHVIVLYVTVRKISEKPFTRDREKPNNVDGCLYAVRVRLLFLPRLIFSIVFFWNFYLV